MNTYRVKFDRIGRNHYVPDLLTEARDFDHLSEQVYRYARPHLASSDVDVTIDSIGRGFISCGFNNGGRFTVSTPVSA
jgi:hypothetical protein